MSLLSILRRKVKKNIAGHFVVKLDAWCIQHTVHCTFIMSKEYKRLEARGTRRTASEGNGSSHSVVTFDQTVSENAVEKSRLTISDKA